MGETPPSLKLDLNLLDVKQMYLIFEEDANLTKTDASIKFDASINQYNVKNESNAKNKSKVNNFRSKFMDTNDNNESNAKNKSNDAAADNFRSKFTNNDVQKGGALLKELENAFIENAKTHNKITFNKLKTKTQIDDKLKKRLVNSFIKHSNPKLIKKMKRYEEDESFLDF